MLYKSVYVKYAQLISALRVAGTKPIAANETQSFSIRRVLTSTTRNSSISALRVAGTKPIAAQRNSNVAPRANLIVVRDSGHCRFKFCAQLLTLVFALAQIGTRKFANSLANSSIAKPSLRKFLADNAGVIFA